LRTNSHRILCWVAGVALLAACATLEDAPDFSEFDHDPPAAADPTTCAAKGGRWGEVGFLRTPTCLFSTRDAGKACTSSAECEARCVVALDGDDSADEPDVVPGSRVQGVCDAEFNDVSRCVQRVHEGRAGEAECVD
jgi:hypothetical protein